MTQEELMIGDWVRVPSELNRYKRIISTFDIDSAVLYEPIPLTTDILEKNGFEKSYYLSLTADGYKKVPVYKYKNMKQVQDICRNLIKVCVNLDGSKYDVEFGIGSHIFDLEYVHQFQHALKLCGIDKEIEL